MPRVRLFSRSIVKGGRLLATYKTRGIHTVYSDVNSFCIRVHVSIAWFDTCIEGVPYRAMLASFESYVGH